MQPEKIKDLTEEDDECEVYEDEDFVTVSSSLAPSVSETWPCLIKFRQFRNFVADFTFLRFFPRCRCRRSKI